LDNQSQQSSSPWLVSQPITAYVGHISWKLSVATLAAASGDPVITLGLSCWLFGDRIVSIEPQISADFRSALMQTCYILSVVTLVCWIQCGMDSGLPCCSW